MLLTGSIFVTSNEDIILNLDCVNTLTRIISLDEDDILPESPVIIGGTCLLPPPTAKIAEADGNEALYDQIYAEHLLPCRTRSIADGPRVSAATERTARRR